MKEIFARITNESPSFFKKVQTVGITIGAIGAALMAAPGLPEVAMVIAGHMITAGVIAAAIGKCTVTDNSVLPKKD